MAEFNNRWERRDGLSLAGGEGREGEGDVKLKLNMLTAALNIKPCAGGLKEASFRKTDRDRCDV